MPTEQPSSEENVANSQNDSINQAMNKVIGQDTQSYEDFIGGFQHITKETFAQQKKSAIIPKSSNKKDTVDRGQLNNVNTEQGVVNPKQSYQMSDEELEEEVLDSGTIATDVTSSSCTPRVKFDNFVEDEESDNDTPGYVASFGDGQNLKNEYVTPEETDLNLESNSKHSEDNELRTTELETDVGGNYDVSKNVNTENTNESEEPDSISEIIVDHICCKDADQTNDDVKHSTDGDLEIIDTGSCTQQNTLYPGEADPEQELPEREITKHTNLDFSAVIAKCEEPLEKEREVCSESTNEVQPFSLDNDFDYDNVILTPKFTMQEMEHMKSFLPKSGVKT